MDIFSSVEFYVIIITAAILLFGFILHPSKRGEAQTYFFTGKYINSENQTPSPKLIIESGANGEITFTHTNVNIPDNSGINFVVTIIGNDIRITGKIYENHLDTNLQDNKNIYFTGDCFKPVRYHIFYEIPYSGQWTAANFTNKEENRITLDLKL